MSWTRRAVVTNSRGGDNKGTFHSWRPGVLLAMSLHHASCSKPFAGDQSRCVPRLHRQDWAISLWIARRVFSLISSETRGYPIL